MNKKDLSSYIKAEICSIPCLLDVTYFKKVEPWKGSPHTCPSDVDYYGYLEIEYEVLDRKGYPAPWLASKVTPLINLDLEAIIREHYTKNGEPEDSLDWCECAQDICGVVAKLRVENERLRKASRESATEVREQVEKLTKERDIKEHCIVQLEAEDLRMKEQLAALAEQNKQLKAELKSIGE